MLNTITLVQSRTQTNSKPTSGIAVDAGTHGNPGKTEYKVVDIATGEEIYRSKVYMRGTNNIGEYLAVVHALAWLKSRGRNDTVYSDSCTARAWVRDGRCKTKFNGTDEELRAIVLRANNWLASNRDHAQVETWQTDCWGETPADYERKSR